MRSLISDHLNEFKAYCNGDDGRAFKTPLHEEDFYMYLKESRLAAEEASMWLGWELANIKKQQESQGNSTLASHPASNLPL